MDPFWAPPTIETDRLVLRPVAEADADAIFAACSNPNLTRFTLFETHQTRDDSHAFVRNYVLRRGFTAGTAGLVVSAMNSWYVFLKLAKLWERRRGTQGIHRR